MLAFSKRAVQAGDAPDFALYVRQDERYALYHAAGETVGAELVAELDGIGYPTLYVHPDDLGRALPFLVGRIERACEGRALADEDRATLLDEAIHFAVQGLARDPSPSSFAPIRAIGRTVAAGARSPVFVRRAIALAAGREMDFARRLHVAAVACALARSARRTASEPLDRLASGCLVLDIGLAWVPPSLWDPSAATTPEERQAHEAHVAFGRRFLAAARVADPLLDSIVAQHHERLDGTGYPHRLAAAEIEPISRLAAAADRFGAIVVGGGAGNVRVFDALHVMVRREAKGFDPIAMRSLVGLFGARGGLAEAA